MKSLILALCITVISGCATTQPSTEVLKVYSQTPIAYLVLMDYIEPSESATKLTSVYLKRLKLLYEDLDTAERSNEVGEFIESNWWRLQLAFVDLKTIDNQIKRYERESGNPIPEQLNSYRTEVNLSVKAITDYRNKKKYVEAGVVAVKILAKVVAAKNGITID